MELSGDHATFLARRDFIIPPGDFTPPERELLAKYGRWLEALASGALTPITPTQEQFVRVARGEGEATTDFERAWMKVVEQRTIAPEIVRTFRALANARADAAALETDYLAARAAVLALVRDQLDAVDAAFLDRIRDAADLATSTEQSLRELVLRIRKSVKLAGISATYQVARVTWDTKRMEAYAQRHPEIREFRKVGKPIVALRFLDQLSMPEPAKPTAQENAPTGDFPPGDG